MRTLKPSLLHAACVVLSSLVIAQALGQTRLASQPGQVPDLMETHGRVTILAPLTPLHLGEKNALALALKGPVPLHIFLSQSTIDAAGVSSPRIQDGDAEATLQHGPDGQLYMDFVPLALGRLDIRISIFFPDGGIDQTSTIVDVVAIKPPIKLSSESQVRDTAIVRLDLSEHGRRRFLRINATYDGVPHPLAIDPAKAHFEVGMSKEAPPIDFDQKTLELKALRSGRALIVTQYEGLSLTTCVQVREFRESYRSAECDESSDGRSSGAYESKLPYGPNDNRTGRFLADDRVDIIAPVQPLHIAQNNPITLRLTGPAIARIDCHPTSGNEPCEAWKGEWSRAGLLFKQNEDGTAFVNLFPMNFGKNEFTFTILFVDGGVALKKLSAEVDAGTAKPTSAGQYCNNPSPERDLPIELVPPIGLQKDFRGKSTIVPLLCYDGVRFAVTPPPTAVTYRVRSEGKDLPIDLDPATGIVTAVRRGQALVQQSFAGLTTDTCVVVASSAEPSASNCRQLRAKYSAPLPPLKAHVQPPHLDDEPERPASGVAGVMGGISLGSAAPAIPTVGALAGARLSPEVRDRFNVDDRLTILTAGLVAELGQPTRLPIRLTGPSVLAINIQQSLVRYNAKLGPIPFEEDASMEERNANRIGRAADGSAYLHLVPLRTGVSEFRIHVLFADGGVAVRNVRIPVKLPAAASPRLVNGLDDSIHNAHFEASILHLSASPPSSRYLFPFLFFDGGISRIALNPAEVEFSLRDSTAEPVVRLDPKTGTVTALRAGHALITTHYAGAQNDTCVVVLSDTTQGDPSTCQELRTP